MDPSRPGHLRSDRAGLHGRGNDPLLLRSRPTSASLHRRDHFNLRLRHRSSPRITPMTCHNDSAPQGGPYRVLTIHKQWKDVPTLILDATLPDIEILKAFYPNV